MGADSPLSAEEKMIFKRLRRGDTVTRIGIDCCLPDRTMSRVTRYIRDRINDL